MVKVRNSIRRRSDRNANIQASLKDHLAYVTNPKVESKVQVKVDDWVFIKIKFSKHPPTPRKVLKKAIYNYISKTKGTSLC